MTTNKQHNRRSATSNQTNNKNRRIIQSSQMPKDFFSGQDSQNQGFKPRWSEVNHKSEDKEIFEEFKSMFKARRNLQTLALKLRPNDNEIEKIMSFKKHHRNKENQIRLPSLLVHSRSQNHFKIRLKDFQQKSAFF